jgi:hypothetical protein
MSHLLFIIFLFISASLFALLEIQIEGKYGWAGELPTWRKFLNFKGLFKPLGTDHVRPLTGYHTYLWLFLMVITHFAYFLTPFSLAKEFLIISFNILLTITEDFLWFVYNPNFGIKKFNKESAKWHTSWFLGIPTSYWFSIPVGIILYIFSTKIF